MSTREEKIEFCKHMLTVLAGYTARLYRGDIDADMNAGIKEMLDRAVDHDEDGHLLEVVSMLMSLTVNDQMLYVDHPGLREAGIDRACDAMAIIARHMGRLTERAVA